MLANDKASPTHAPPARNKIRTHATSSEASRALLQDRHLYALAPRKRHKRPVALPNDEDVAQSSCKAVACRVLQVNNVKRALVLFAGNDHANTTRILATGDHGQVSCLKFDDL